MGLWGDIAKQTGYDSEPDPVKRETIRGLYLSKAKELGYDEDTAKSVLEEEGVFAAEEARQKETAAHAEAVRVAHTPEYRAKMDQKVAAARDPLEVAEEAYRAQMKGEAPPEPLKYRLPENALTDKELADRYVAAAATGDPEKDAKLAMERSKSPFFSGLRNSIFGTSSINELPKDQQGVVQRAIAAATGEIEADRKEMSFGQRVLSKTEEMAGTMAGSPTTYIAPMIPAAAALPVLAEGAPVAAHLAMGAVRGVLNSPGLMYGAASGLENATTQHNLGNEDVSTEKEMAKGALLGKAGEIVGKPLGVIAESIGSKAAAPVGTAAGLAGNAAGFGGVQTAVEIAGGIKDKSLGIDPRGYGDIFSDAMTGFGANMMMGVPQSVLAHRNIEAQRHVMKGDYEKALAVREKTIAESIQNISAKYADAEILNKYIPDQATLPGFGPERTDVKAGALEAERGYNDMDADAKRRINNTLGIGETVKNKGLAIGEKVVDTKIRALSFLRSVAIKERAAMISEGKARGMKRGEMEDAINKGTVELPLAAELSERIKAMPTEMQTMVHEANNAMAPVYYGFTAGEAKTFDRYVMSRNFLSAKQRAEARGEKYTTPISPESLVAYIKQTEASPRGEEYAKRAAYLYEISRQMVDMEHRAGVISDDQRDRLLGVGDHIGIEHLEPVSEYRGDKNKGKQTANSSDMFDLLGEGDRRGINTDVAGIMHQRIVRAQLEAYKNKTNLGFLEYATRENPADRNGFRVLKDGEEPGVGEAEIAVRDGGEVKKVAMPKWLKDSLERDSEATKGIIKALGFISFAGPVRKLAVQWNPEFAMANIPRDFGRYYRLMAAADSKRWGAADLSAAANFLKANPLTYAADMAKNIAAVRADATMKTVNGIHNRGKDVKVKYEGADWYERALQNNALRGVISQDSGSPLNTPSAGEAVYNGLDKALGYCGEFSENLLRVAAFKSFVDRGFTEKRAGQIVGQFLDYNRHGSMSKAWDRIIPFFNVAIQAPRADVRTLRDNPAAYASRVAWAAMSYTTMAMLAYSLDDGESTKQTPARTRASSVCVPHPKPNADGSYRMLAIPLDQQDRLLAALCDSMVRISLGKPIDWERLQMAGRDFASINPDMLRGIPSLNATSTLLDHRNYDPYRGTKISFAKDGMTAGAEGSWHLAYDPVRDPKWAIAFAQKAYPMVDWQPAAIDYAARSLFPHTFFTKVYDTGMNAVEGKDQKLSNIPMISRVVKDTDPKQPLRDAAEQGQFTKNVKDLETYRESRLESQVTDPDEYRDMMMQKVEDAPISQKRVIVDRFKEGYKDRIIGVDPETKFLKSQTDPSAWEELDKLHPFTDNPRVIKKFEKYKAGRDADSQ